MNHKKKSCTLYKLHNVRIKILRPNPFSAEFIFGSDTVPSHVIRILFLLSQTHDDSHVHDVKPFEPISLLTTL